MSTRHLKKVSIFSIILLLLIPSFSQAQVDYPDPVGHVNDFANILTSSQVETLENQLRTYEENTSIEVAVVTTPSLEGLSEERYTVGLAQEWGVGKEDKDNGVVFLIAPIERRIRIEVGYGLEPYLTDSQSGRIYRDVASFLPQGNERWYEGVSAGVDAIITQLGDVPYDERSPEEARQESEGPLLFFFLILLGLVFVIFISAVISAGGGSGGGYTSTRRRYTDDDGYDSDTSIATGILICSSGSSRRRSSGSDFGGGSGLGGGGFGGFGGGGFGGGGAGGGF